MSTISSNYDAILRKVLISNSVADAIAQIRDDLGLGHVTYHMVFKVGDPLDNPYVRTTYPPEWVSTYLLSNFAAIDPVILHGLSHSEPFFWEDLPTTPDAARIFAEAQKFGISLQGYSVPFTDSKGRGSLFSVTAPAPSPDWRQQVDVLSHSLELLAKDVHFKALSEAYAMGDDMPQLAPRELECLQWCAEGKTYSEMAVILGLSEHTVRSYLKAVRLRLDCVSLAQAVNKAAKMKII